MESVIYKPRCQGCKEYKYYSAFISLRTKGVMLKSGDTYCDAKKKIVKFKKRELKGHVPNWCPLRNTPVILRVYSLNDNIGLLSAEPLAHNYALKHTNTIEMDATEFWQSTNEMPLDKLIDIPANLRDVIEIDDGLKPYYFQVLSYSFVKVISFNGELARNNKLKKSNE